MRKRILSLLLIFALLCVPAAHAQDVYDLINDALYRIVLRTETGDQVLGSGVLFMADTVVLTAEGCCAEGNLYVLGADGEHAVNTVEYAGNSGAALLHLATPSAAEPLMLSNYEYTSLPYLFGTNGQAGLGAMNLYQMRYGMYRGQETLVLSSEEGFLPGAVVVDEQGAVVSLVVGHQAEGAGEYTALSPDNLYSALTENPFLPIEITWAYGQMVITWTDEVRTKGGYIISVIGDMNNYYTTYEANYDANSIALSVPPGHSYWVQVHYATSGQEEQAIDWARMMPYTIPSLPLTLYDFTEECSLVSGDADITPVEELPAVTITTPAALLAQNKAQYLQTINSYIVPQEIEAFGSVELIAPDGQFFFYEGLGYVLLPGDGATELDWLDVTDLFRSSARFSGGELLKGEYRLRHFVGGYLAGECVFTVE